MCNCKDSGSEKALLESYKKIIALETRIDVLVSLLKADEPITAECACTILDYSSFDQRNEV